MDERGWPGTLEVASAERMSEICLVDGVFTMSARHLPGAADTSQKLKRAGSPGHARSAPTLVRPGRDMAAPLAHPGQGRGILPLARRLVGASGAWLDISPLVQAGAGFRLALVAGDLAGHISWGAAI